MIETAASSICKTLKHSTTACLSINRENRLIHGKIDCVGSDRSLSPDLRCKAVSSQYPPLIPMKLFLIPLFTLLILSHALSAQSAEQPQAVTVEGIDFNSLRSDWIQMEVELACEGNFSPEARDPDYLENVKVKVYLAYLPNGAQAPDYDYYTSELEIAIMERQEDYNVYFYLPGLIAERDGLRDEPEFFYVEVIVDGEAQSPKGGSKAISDSIANLKILQSFLSKAESEGQVNEHLLMPIYLVSGTDPGRVSDLPIFLRRDVRD